MRGGIAGALICLAACSGSPEQTSKPEPADTTPDASEDNTAVDSSPREPEYFEASLLVVTADFGWDSEARSLVDVNTSTGAIPSAVVLRYGSPEWEADGFDSNSEHYCVVLIPFTQSQPAIWVNVSASYWIGFDYNSADGLSTNCDRGDGLYDFDPALWGDDPISPLVGYGWGLGVGELNPEFASVYSGSPYESMVFGGIIPSTLLPPEADDDYVAFALQIDAEYDVITEDGLAVPLDRSAINLGGNIASAWYRLNGPTVWGFEFQ